LKNKIGLISVVLALIFLPTVYFITRNKPVKQAVKELSDQTGLDKNRELIGGQVDDHGCLTAAGYGFDASVSACIRFWELSEQKRRAAAWAVSTLPDNYGVVVLGVLPNSKCHNCFNVELQLLEGDRQIFEFKGDDAASGSAEINFND